MMRGKVIIELEIKNDKDYSDSVSSQFIDSGFYILYYFYITMRDMKEAYEYKLSRKIKQNGGLQLILL